MKKRDQIILPSICSILKLIAGFMLFLMLASLIGGFTSTANATQKLATEDFTLAEEAYRLGRMAYQRNDYQAARDHYYRALELNPENPLYLNGVGFLALTLGEYDKSIKYFEKALAIDLKTLGPRSEEHTSELQSH